MEQVFQLLNNNNYDDFFSLFIKTFSDNQEINILDINSFKNYLEFLHISDKTSFLMTDNQKAIGLFLSAMRNEKAYIPAISVLKDYRGQGYGRILLQKGLSLLNENNCKSVTLEVLKSNSNAVKLYNSEGFNIINEINNYRNENNSFYNKYNNDSLKIEKNSNMTFNFLYNNFIKAKRPWQKHMQTILLKINKYNCILNILKKEDITIGYAVCSTKNNSLILHDIFLNENHFNILPVFLSDLICTEKIVQVNCIYADNPICSAFENIGFYIDSQQYEMERKL